MGLNDFCIWLWTILGNLKHRHDWQHLAGSILLVWYCFIKNRFKTRQKFLRDPVTTLVYNLVDIRFKTTSSEAILPTLPKKNNVSTTVTNRPDWSVETRQYAHLSRYLISVDHCRNAPEWTRMWANTQPDGRPAEHRWRPLFNALKFGWRPLLDAVQ